MAKVKVDQHFKQECWWLKYNGNRVSCNSKRMILQASEAIRQIQALR